MNTNNSFLTFNTWVCVDQRERERGSRMSYEKSVDFRMYALTWIELGLQIIGVDIDNGYNDCRVIVKSHWDPKNN